MEAFLFSEYYCIDSLFNIYIFIIRFQNVQDDPTNRCIISRLFDLITDDIFFQESNPFNQDLPRGTHTVTSTLSNDRNKEAVGTLEYSEQEAYQEEENDFEISSSATIKWCCSIALHLLQLSLNINEKRPRAFTFQEIKSDK